MKRIILALCMLLVGCKSTPINDNFGISDLPLEMIVKVKSYEKGVLTIIVDNQSGYEMSFDYYFKLEKKDNGKLEEIPFVDGVIIEEKTYVLKDLESIEIEYNCDYLYGGLEKGTYQISQDDLIATFVVE